MHACKVLLFAPDIAEFPETFSLSYPPGSLVTSSGFGDWRLSAKHFPKSTHFPERTPQLPELPIAVLPDITCVGQNLHLRWKN